MIAICLLGPAPAPSWAAAVIVATITYPANGATNTDLSRPIQWTSVPGAQAYYLYVGTAVGAKDLVDTGETSQTSYQPLSLPGGQTLFIRLWTKWGGGWQFVDSQFTRAPVAILISPPAGATNVDLTRAFIWAPVTGAQAYYLWVGTAVGAKDVVNTGETLQTSYQSGGLPPGVTLYTRLWTKWGAVWRSVDSQFATTPLSTLTAPVSGASNVALTSTFTWTTVPGAQAYYLYVGSTAGAKDLVNTGEIQRTSYTVTIPWLQPAATEIAWDQPLEPPVVTGYAVVLDGNRTDLGPLPLAQCLGSTGSAWCYRVPTPPRALGSHALQVSAYNMLGEGMSDPVTLAAEPRTVYTRLWTKVAGSWRYSDSSFTLAKPVADFVYPPFGATNVDTTKPLVWTAVPSADAYSLAIGFTPGGNELVNLPEVDGTSYLTSPRAPLPGDLRIFARLGTRVQGIWRYSETTFTTLWITRLIFPDGGAVDVPRSTSFSWTPSTGAQAYYLYVGTTAGAKDVVNTGEVQKLSYYATALPALTTLYARLWIKIGGAWRYLDSQFTTKD